MDKIDKADTALDLAALRKDINSGAVFQKDAATVDAVRTMLRLGETPGSNSGAGSGNTTDEELLKWLLLQSLSQGQGGSGIPDIFGTGKPDQPADNRYYLTFVLGYDNSLIQAELERKGLDQSAKLEKVEVAQ